MISPSPLEPSGDAEFYAGGVGPPKPLPVEPGPPTPALRRRIGIVLLLAGVGAGLASWLGGETIHGSFDPELVDGFHPRAAALAGDQASAGLREAMIAFGLLGALLGMVLGLAGGLARSSAGRAVATAVLGLVLGLAAGVGTARALVPIYQRQNVDEVAENLIIPLLIHGGIWSAIGAAAGLAFGFGLGGGRRVARGLLGGLLGAVAATLIYEVIGALLFPIHRTYLPISASWGSRLLARLSVAVFVAGAVGLTMAEGRDPPRGAAREGLS